MLIDTGLSLLTSSLSQGFLSSDPSSINLVAVDALASQQRKSILQIKLDYAKGKTHVSQIAGKRQHEEMHWQGWHNLGSIPSFPVSPYFFCTTSYKTEKEKCNIIAIRDVHNKEQQHNHIKEGNSFIEGDGAIFSRLKNQNTISRSTFQGDSLWHNGDGVAEQALREDPHNTIFTVEEFSQPKTKSQYDNLNYFMQKRWFLARKCIQSIHLSSILFTHRNVRKVFDTKNWGQKKGYWKEMVIHSKKIVGTSS
ncbi:hypothetical protein ACJX0J_005315, partial [Zea mays]